MKLFLNPWFICWPVLSVRLRYSWRTVPALRGNRGNRHRVHRSLNCVSIQYGSSAVHDFPFKRVWLALSCRTNQIIWLYGTLNILYFLLLYIYKLQDSNQKSLIQIWIILRGFFSFKDLSCTHTLSHMQTNTHTTALSSFRQKNKASYSW